MKVVVLVKDVPAELAQYTAALTLDRSGESAMSGVDVFTVGEGVRLAAGDECVVVTMGPAGAIVTLREALMLGASRAIHVFDEALVGSDALTTTRILAAVIEREAADVVLLGRESSDARMGTLAGMVAEVLSWPLLSAVDELSIGVDATSLSARRRDDYGTARVRTTLPAVASVAEYANSPVEVGARDLERGLTAQIEVLTAADLGVSPAASVAAVFEVTTVERVRRHELFTGDPVEYLESLLAESAAS